MMREHHTRCLSEPELWYGPDEEPGEKSPSITSNLRWNCRKVDLGEVLVGLYNARAFASPDGQIPTFAEVVSQVEQMLDISLGESADLARKVRNRSQQATFLQSLIEALPKYI